MKCYDIAGALTLAGILAIGDKPSPAGVVIAAACIVAALILTGVRAGKGARR